MRFLTRLKSEAAGAKCILLNTYHYNVKVLEVECLFIAAPLRPVPLISRYHRQVKPFRELPLPVYSLSFFHWFIGHVS